MKFFEFLTSIALLGLGLWLLLFLAKIVWAAISPLLGRPKLPTKGRPLKQKPSPFAKIDQLIENEKYPKAEKLILGSLRLSSEPSITNIVEFQENCDNALDRLLTISEKSGKPIKNISSLEERFLELRRLNKEVAQTKEAFAKLKSKRALEGKTIPSWSKKEFSEKLLAVRKARKAAGAKLKKELGRIKDSVDSPPDDIVLH